MKSKIEVYGRANVEFKQLAERVALETIKEMKQPDCFEVSIKFVSETEIKRLNSEFRNIDKVTDVLSFPSMNIRAGETFSKEKHAYFYDGFDEELFYLGDMAICSKQLDRQAKEFGVTVKDELKKLVIHSILHLLGFDHIKDSDYEIMRKQEIMLEEKIKI